MDKLFVVIGTTGEYSDRSEWLVRAFKREADARTYVEALQDRRKQLPQRDWENDLAIEAAMREFDPQYSEDYTGTSWFVRSVDYDDGAPL